METVFNIYIADGFVLLFCAGAIAIILQRDHEQSLLRVRVVLAALSFACLGQAYREFSGDISLEPTIPWARIIMDCAMAAICFVRLKHPEMKLVVSKAPHHTKGLAKGL